MSAHNGSHAGAGVPRDRDASQACRWTESWALEAMGALPADEAQRLIDHLESGCVACSDEHARVAETLAAMDALELAERAELPAPSAQVRAKLMQAIEATAAEQAATLQRPWQQLTSVSTRQFGGGLCTVADGPEGWLRTALAGIEVKPLHVDKELRRVSMLVRMAPGSSYPKHRHASSEECFVVSGEIQVGERTLRTGDYQVAAEGSVHGVQSTETGCVLFIVSSQEDELL